MTDDEYTPEQQLRAMVGQLEVERNEVRQALSDSVGIAREFDRRYLLAVERAERAERRVEELEGALKLARHRLGRIVCDDLTDDPGLLVCRPCDVRSAIDAALARPAPTEGGGE